MNITIIKLTLLTFIGFYATIACADSLNKKRCTHADATKAEKEAAYISDWESLYKSYERYGHCDDGSIAEGYVESIKRLLTQNWGRIIDIKDYIVKDKDFEQFILRHINELMSNNDLRQIEKNVKEECPAGLESFCASIDKTVLILKKQLSYFRTSGTAKMG